MISEVLVGLGLIATSMGSLVYQSCLTKKISKTAKNLDRRNTENIKITLM
jgi:hypothetical protein